MAASIADWLTDRIARRPAGWLGRALYRKALGHRPGFDAVLREVPPAPGEHILDVGCGGGAFLARVLATGASACGFDHSTDMLATTADQNAAAVAAGRLHLDQGDAGALPYADGRFDRVYCLNAFFFFPDPARATAEMARVLKPGGTLAIITTPPEQAARMRAFFGPIGRRMRFDAPEDLDRWGAPAGLARLGLHAVGPAGFLHVARKGAPA
ncbi:class I SAM-dependent methyltransferase [Zavarzinia compransoris]|nr:methyltransferase domain-containing protein [Zavarzinia compransoris]TDP44898.1 ubiquinone/menaquinone biosynthesis C-methylase UbiE [Zavarzinia compransoris]